MDKVVNILLVEDNPGDVRLIEEMLRDNTKEKYSIKNINTLEVSF